MEKEERLRKILADCLPLLTITSMFLNFYHSFFFSSKNLLSNLTVFIKVESCRSQNNLATTLFQCLGTASGLYLDLIRLVDPDPGVQNLPTKVEKN